MPQSTNEIMNLIEQIVNYIIRPTRERYHINRLGQRDLDIPASPRSGRAPINVVRYDGQVRNKKQEKVVYSIYVNSAADMPDCCVVYLHANNGSRVEGMYYL